ncbi:MAG: FAD-dependent oxidoreductase [Deltaproteobacteria bacterium]|nr:FAD-dependent oxidoreductase [Deltaproteobacteria bacterium]MBW2344872.1 FAD-dependent oxidoreductase [Deltaproteobacteria bacterium]
MSKKTDVLIIGGGISGISVSRELSKHNLDVTLVEKEADVGWGQTKASYANRHPGARWTPGTLAQQMIAEANQVMDQLIEDLDIEFRRSGELVLAFNKEELESLKTMKKQAEHINVEGLEIIGPDEIKRMEPNVNSAAIAALYMPTAGVFNPFEQVLALYENARENGVQMILGTEVTGIIPENGKFIVETNRDEIRAGYIVNAAGLFAERIAKMAGADSFKIRYDTKSTCIILDPLLGNIVQHIVSGVNDLKVFVRYKLVTPTFDDKILLYTTFPEPAKGIEDRAVEKRMIDLTIESAKVLVPDVDFEKNIVASFSGLTARNDRGDFIIEASEKLPTFVNVALPPPGITCSPAIGKRVVNILKDNGLRLREKMNFNPYRKSIKSLRGSSPMQVRDLIGKDPCYGNVVCRCETVTEGEIAEAVKRGATTLDGVKFRTRAGMGRCQANFCGSKVTDILAREQNQSFENITKKGRHSNYINQKGS